MSDTYHCETCLTILPYYLSVCPKCAEKKQKDKQTKGNCEICYQVARKIDKKHGLKHGYLCYECYLFQMNKNNKSWGDLSDKNKTYDIYADLPRLQELCGSYEAAKCLSDHVLKMRKLEYQEMRRKFYEKDTD